MTEHLWGRGADVWMVEVVWVFVTGTVLMDNL